MFICWPLAYFLNGNVAPEFRVSSFFQFVELEQEGKLWDYNFKTEYDYEEITSMYLKYGLSTAGWYHVLSKNDTCVLIYEDFDLDLDNYSNPIKLAFREFETGTVLNEIRKEYNFLCLSVSFPKVVPSV